MSHRLRHVIATSAVSALALGGAVLAPASASAAEPSCDNPAALHSAVVSAQGAVAAASADMKAANRPLGAQVAAKRHAAKAELAQSRTELRALRDQAKLAPKATRKSLIQQMRQERRDIARARNLLTVKHSLLAQIKAERRAAHAELKAARAMLRRLEALQAGCS
jgi:hypothetical protein